MGQLRPFLFLLCLLGGHSAACGGKRDKPEDLAEAYRLAVERKDAAALRKLLERPAMAALSEREITALLARYPKEFAQQAKALKSAPDLERRAYLELPSGERLVLHWVDGKWKVDAGILTTPALRTPTDAMAELLRQLRRIELDGLLNLLSHRYRADFVEELKSLRRELREPAMLEVEIEDDKATVRTDAGRKIKLTKERGQWRIDGIGAATDSDR